MTSITEIMQLCRLCLVKEQVNIPIFEEQGDLQQIIEKISACLPVKVSKEDKLPKKICDGCSYKLELLYQFRNTTVTAEKQLLSWINQLGGNKVENEVKSQPATHHIVKEEVDIVDTTDHPDTEYLLGQQITFEGGDTPFLESQDDNGAGDDDITNSSDDEPLAKRRKRLLEDKGQISAGESKEEVVQHMAVTKTEDASESEGEENVDDPEPNFVSVGTDDIQQPGPSGVGKAVTTDIPAFEPLITLSEGESRTMKWSRKLPEIDIIPLEKATNHVTDPLLGAKSDDVMESSEDEDTTKVTVPSGYVNPFIYKKTCWKLGQKKNKNFEHANQKWACMICNFVAKDKKSLMDHYDIHKLEKDAKVEAPHWKEKSDYFICSICYQEFTSLKAYEKHFDRHHGERTFTCFICEKFYKDAFQLCIHNYLAHSTTDKYFCVLCEFKTISRKSLRDHIQGHEDSCLFKCDVCGRGFENETSLEEHKTIHGAATIFCCDVCGENFDCSTSFEDHKKIKHPEIENTTGNECHLCNKNFANKKSLILHIRGHTGESSVLCDMCGKRLTSSEHLKQHLRVHTGYKPHTCNVCGKGFAKKCNLTLHERVHSGEKPYVCKVCSKAFSQRSTLVIHERYHSGERPYVCNLCNKGFVAKGLLSVHIKSCTVIPAEYLMNVP